MNRDQYWKHVEYAAQTMQDHSYEPELVEDIIWDDRQWLSDWTAYELTRVIMYSDAPIPDGKPDWSLYKVASKMFCRDVREYYVEHLWGNVDG